MKRIVIVITLLAAVCQVSFAQGTRAQRTGAQVDSVQQTRAQQARAQRTRVQQPRAQQARAQRTRAQQTGAQVDSVQQTKAQQARAQRTRAQVDSVQQTRAQRTMAQQARAQRTRAQRDSTQRTGAQVDSVQQARAQVDSVQQTRAQRDSTQQTRVQQPKSQVKRKSKNTNHIQKWAVSTSVLDMVNFGTVNFQGERRIARNWTAAAGFRYNPWEWKDTEGNAMHNKARTLNLGVCFWPWRNYSGWWVSVKGQIEEYNVGNVLGFKKDYEGYAYGGTLSVGYALMIGRHLNLTFGLGAWAGWTDYTLYTHPTYGRILDQGGKFFVSPSNETKIGLMYIF